MLIYYSFIISMIIISMFIMLVVASVEKILPSESKRGFSILFSTVIILAVAEWIGVYIEYADVQWHYISLIRVIVMFSIIPIAPMVVVSSIGEIKYDSIYKVVFVINFILQCLSAKFGFIFYLDENNIYHRGDYYWVYITSYMISTAILFYSMYQLGRTYQSKSNYVLLLIGLLLMLGITIQMLYPHIYYVWLSIAIASVLLYVYFYSLISQMDPLTKLLNRRCYDNQLQYLKRDVVIVYLDVDKFKNVNDEFGHIYGDYCLTTIGQKIRRVYGLYGDCYRIGGDEFCIILDRNLRAVEDLNTKFTDEIMKKKEVDINIPSVSIGYGYYGRNDADITRAIHKADKMMYEGKHKDKTK